MSPADPSLLDKTETPQEVQVIQVRLILRSRTQELQHIITSFKDQNYIEPTK